MMVGSNVDQTLQKEALAAAKGFFDSPLAEKDGGISWCGW